MRMERLIVGILLALVVVLALLLVERDTQAQGETWQFVAARRVLIASSRAIAAERYWMQPGESITVSGPYVQSDDLIWLQVAGNSQFVAVARYGSCEIRSFGSYQPADRAPASIPPL